VVVFVRWCVRLSCTEFMHVNTPVPPKYTQMHLGALESISDYLSSVERDR